MQGCPRYLPPAPPLVILDELEPCPRDGFRVAVEGELDGAIAGAKGVALVVVNDPMFLARRVHIMELTLRSKVPSVFGQREYVTADGLMIGAQLSASSTVFSRARSLQNIPIQQPTKFELAINVKSAKTLRITIPQSLLRRADEVIQ